MRIARENATVGTSMMVLFRFINVVMYIILIGIIQ